MEILHCNALTKTYGKGEAMVTALDNVTLSIEKGEFVAVMGASGSGKSTLMHLMGGVDRATSGSVLIEGTDLATLSEAKLSVFRRRKVGLIYQFYNLIPTLSVKKNILLPMSLDGRAPSADEFNDLIKTLGLTDRLEHLPSQLSGGQQQRAAIARSLIYRPAVLLADEPTGNLDRKNSNEIIELLKLSNKKYKQTIILITHDERVAVEADRILVMEDGKVTREEVKGA